MKYYGLLRRLSFEKDEIEKKIFNLNQIREKQEMDIFNFNEEKFNINNQNAEKGNLILSRSGENADIYNEINDEKIINKNLIFELRDKENNLFSNQKQLNKFNVNIDELKNDVNELINIINKTNQDIDNINDNIIKEKAELDKLINDNNYMNNYIHDSDMKIKLLVEENDLLKQNNRDLDRDNIKINNTLDDYKKHLILLVSQNKILCAELQLLLGRDNEINLILDRTESLKELRKRSFRKQ